MRRTIFILSLFSVIAASCGDSGASRTGASDNSGKRVALHENGLKVTSALLLKEDGSELPANSTVSIGEKVLCRLTIEGWKVEDGKVLLGASEKITSSAGDVLLNEPDLFESYGPANAEDAKTVTLRAVVTALHKSIHDFEVAFRVWDKRSYNEVTGSFPFHLN